MVAISLSYIYNLGLGQVGLCASLQNLLARFDSGRALNACWRRELLHNWFVFYFLRLLQHFVLDLWCRWLSGTLAWSTKGIRSIRFGSTCMSSFWKGFRTILMNNKNLIIFQNSELKIRRPRWDIRWYQSSMTWDVQGIFGAVAQVVSSRRTENPQMVVRLHPAPL